MSTETRAIVLPALVLSLVCGVNLLAGWSFGDLDEARWHLGAEYFNIAQAIADGRGFSDPFGEPTGPTAWMPPFLPYLYAIVLKLSSSKGVVSVFALAISELAYVVSGLLLLDVGHRWLKALRPWWVLAFFASWLIVFRYWYVELTSDIWLVSFILTLLVFLWSREEEHERFVHPCLWGLLGGFISVAAPAAGVAWALCLGILKFRIRGNWLRFGATAALTLALATPWLVRNYSVFGRIIPTKANAGYEFYQAHLLDDDGIYDLKTMQGHPYNNTKSRFDYMSQGETAFIETSTRTFRSAVRREPGEFLKRVGARANAALVYYTPLIPTEAWPELPLRRVLFVSPLLALAIALGGRTARRGLVGICVIWAAYLLPYVAVAYYIRYSLPLLPVYCLVTALGVDCLLALLPALPRLDLSNARGLLGGEPWGQAHATVRHQLSASSTVAIAIPCLNEAVTIGPLVRELKEALPGAVIYVYDNASTDGTIEQASKAGAVVREVTERGKGNVVRAICRQLREDVLVLLDGDLTYAPGDAVAMIDRLVTENLDMVIGRRKALQGEAAYPALHRLGNWAFFVILRVFFRSPIKDPLSGYRVVRGDVARAFPCTTSEFEVEMEFNLYCRDERLRLLEMDVDYRGRPPGSSSKLSTFSDGWKILLFLGSRMKGSRARAKQVERTCAS